MRITSMITILATAAAMVASAEESGNTVRVHLRDGFGAPPQITYPVRFVAARMFAGIGVRLQWCSAEPCGSTRPIEIYLDTNTPENLRPGALAYAMPVEGVHIRVFYDRVERLGGSNPTWLLAHVLVHEITHILQGCARHSPEGIMKAQFTPVDIVDMRRKPLPFSTADVRLIRAGLERRENDLVVKASLETMAVVTR